jgi:hypothetical protein
MSNVEQAGKVLAVLGKQGKAIVLVNLVPYANDEDFARNPPSCRVTVTTRDPSQSDKIVDQFTADIPSTTLPYQHEFVLKVETVVESFGKYIGFPAKRALRVDVRADPIGGYEQWYAPDDSNRDIEIRAGSQQTRNVSLKPTYENSRLDPVRRLDKPRLSLPPNDP